MPQSRDPSKYPGEYLALLRKAVSKSEPTQLSLPTKSDAHKLRFRLHGLHCALRTRPDLFSILAAAMDDYEIVLRNPNTNRPPDKDYHGQTLLIIRLREDEALRRVMTEELGITEGEIAEAEVDLTMASHRHTSSPASKPASLLDITIPEDSNVFGKKEED